jgi:hypothetical protein
MKHTRCIVATLLITFVPAAPSVAEEEPTAKDYLNFFKPTVGSWKSTVEIDGQVMEGVWSTRLSPTEWCYVEHGKGNGQESQSIAGYDAEIKGWKVTGFDSEGTLSVLLYRVHNMQDVNPLGVGATGSSEGKRVTVDGETTTTSGEWTCKECGKAKMVFLMTNRTENGQKQPDLKWVIERMDKSAH